MMQPDILSQLERLALEYPEVAAMVAENAKLTTQRDALREYYDYVKEHATMPRHTMIALHRIVFKIVTLGAHKS